MLNKLVEVLKEVFWLKKSTPKKRRSAVKKTIKKKTVKKASKTSTVKPKPKAAKAPKATVIKPPKPPKAPKKPAGPVIDPNLKPLGEITHYFDRIKVCVIKITQGTVLIGDKITVISGKTKFVQKVWSMQIESVDVKVAKKGQLIGIKIDKAVAPGDIVYK